MRNVHCRPWNMARKLQITEYQKHTLDDLNNEEINEKRGKFSNVHSGTWNMARKLKIMENEKHPLDDLKNDEITKKREK